MVQKSKKRKLRWVILWTSVLGILFILVEFYFGFLTDFVIGVPNSSSQEQFGLRLTILAIEKDSDSRKCKVRYVIEHRLSLYEQDLVFQHPWCPIVGQFWDPEGKPIYRSSAFIVPISNYFRDHRIRWHFGNVELEIPNDARSLAIELGGLGLRTNKVNLP